MVAFNRDEIGPCKRPGFARFTAEARLALVLGERCVCDEVATRTLWRKPGKELEGATEPDANNVGTEQNGGQYEA